MGLFESHGPSASSAPPPPWWNVDGAEVPFDSLETADLPDESEFLKKLVRAQARAYREQKELIETLRRKRTVNYTLDVPRGGSTRARIGFEASVAVRDLARLVR